MMSKLIDTSYPCKIRVTKEVMDIFPQYRPAVGRIYDAVYRNLRSNEVEFCVIDVRDKKIILRRGEFEVVEMKTDKDNIHPNPCPKCGAKVNVRLTGKVNHNWFVLKTDCEHYPAFRSAKYPINNCDSAAESEKAYTELIEAWNGRADDGK